MILRFILSVRISSGSHPFHSCEFLLCSVLSNILSCLPACEYSDDAGHNRNIKLLRCLHCYLMTIKDKTMHYYSKKILLPITFDFC